MPTIKLTGLTEEQKCAYRLADNRLPLNAGWDSDLLKLEVTDLLDADFNLSLTGFTQQEIDDLLVVIDPPGGDIVLKRYPLQGITTDMVYAATMSQPFQGEWAEGLETDRMTRIVNAVRHG